jgi:hypothetical protein
MAAAKKEEKKPVMSCASSGHITKLKKSIFPPFDIYGTTLSAEMFTFRSVQNLNSN